MTPKMGLVALASQYELGGERAEELLTSTAQSLREAGVDIVVGKHIVENVEQALGVCDQLKDSGITTLMLLDATWQGDSIKYLFTQELGLPTAFWAVPYPDTYAIACVQHYGSILTAQGIPFQYVYGLPSDSAAVRKAVLIAKAGHLIHTLNNSRIALVGPRNAWRIAGPQEMVNEEWQFSKKFGTTIIHLEMDAITDVAKEVSDEEAAKVLKELASRTGTVTADQATMLWMAKVYVAVKGLFKKYNLDAVAAECYPRYAGLVNVVATWLGDEGLIVETEGDIAGSLAMHLLNTAAQGDPVAPSSILGEVGSYDDKTFVFAHEGSTATAYAEKVDDVVVQQMDDGTQVCFKVRPMPKATVCSLVGGAGSYKMLVAQASTEQASQEEWHAAGARMFAKVRFNEPPGSAMTSMIREGIDHHWVIKEGDYAELMEIVCNYLQVETLKF